MINPMDTYDLIRTEPSGTIRLSIRQIAARLKIPERKVRSELARLIADGLVKRTKYKSSAKASMTNEYTALPVKSGVAAETVMAIYTRYASERMGRDLPLNVFHKHAVQFQHIATMCTELYMDVHAYVLACYWTFPKGWCQRKFGVPYPPVQIMAGRTKARDHYDCFIRHYLQNDVETEPMSEVGQSIHIIQELELEKDKDRLILFVQNGTILPEVFIVLPFISKEDIDRSKISLVKLDMKLVKLAQKALNAK